MLCTEDPYEVCLLGTLPQNLRRVGVYQSVLIEGEFPNGAPRVEFNVSDPDSAELCVRLGINADLDPTIAFGDICRRHRIIEEISLCPGRYAELRMKLDFQIRAERTVYFDFTAEHGKAIMEVNRAIVFSSQGEKS